MLDFLLSLLRCPANLRDTERLLRECVEAKIIQGNQIASKKTLISILQSDLERCSHERDAALRKLAALEQAIQSMKVPPPPQHIKGFTSNDIRAVLNAQEKQAFTFDWIPWDEVYPVVSWQDWETFINHDDTQAFKYDARRFDCNRFACVYFGRALAWGGSLLLMWGVTLDHNVGHMWDYLLGFDHTLADPVLERRHFEPQNDLVWRPWEKPWELFRAYG